MSPEKAKQIADLVQQIESSEKWGAEQRNHIGSRKNYLASKRSSFALELAELERPILLAEEAEAERVLKVAAMREELEKL